MFKKIGGNIFQNTLSKSGILNQVEASTNLQIARNVFKERFGEGVEVHIKFQYIKQRRLLLEVSHPAIIEEIRMQEQAIVSSINNKIGKAEIIGMFFSVPKN